MVCRSWSRCPCCLNVRPTLSCCRERFVWCCLFDMYLEFVCSRIILPRRVLHALFCLLTECDGCQDSRLTDHIKTRPPRNKTIPGGCFCVVRRSIISEMLCNFGNSSYNFIKQFVYLLKNIVESSQRVRKGGENFVSFVKGLIQFSAFFVKS